MSDINQRRELVSGLFESMNSRDFSTFEAITTEDVSLDFPGPGRVEGRRRSLLILRSILRRFSRLTFTISETIIEDQSACVVWFNEGEYNDGTQYENRGVTLIQLKGNLIAGISDYFKDTSFTQT